MEHFPPWPQATPCHLRLARVSRLGGACILLTLLLALCGLALSTLAASAAPAVQEGGQAAAVSPLRPPTRTPRPSPTPTPTATNTPTPTPTPTGVPSPTAASTPTASVIPTAASTAPGAVGGNPAGGESGDQDLAPLGSLLGWGLGGLVLVVLVFSVSILLLTRRTAQAEPHLVPAWAARRAPHPWLNRLRQVLPGLRARAPLEEDHNWERLPPPQEPPSLAPIKPPRWMIEAGLLKEETGEQPAPDPQDLLGKGQESGGESEENQAARQMRKQFRTPHAFTE